MTVTLLDAKRGIENISDTVAIEHKMELSLWLKRFADELAEESCQSNSDIVIGAIQEDIRQALPLEAVLPSEEILPSQTGPTADCDPQTTVHVDSFLYDDDVIDELCDQGKMNRNYCSNCGCKQVLPLTFISHSSSKMQLKYMFEYLLPDLKDKVVLDIGSRTGAVLYAAHFYGAADRIVGVELNEAFCKIQQTIIDKYELSDHIKVIHSDICNQEELVRQADVIVMNNVFEFFAPVNVQERVWQFLRSAITRPGMMLVTSPSLQQSLTHLQTGINLESWVQKVDCENKKLKGRTVLELDETEMDDIHLYTVIRQTLSPE